MVERQTWEMQLDESLATLIQEVGGYKRDKENDIDGHLSDLDKKKAKMEIKAKLAQDEKDANGFKK